jgi:rare lipoprotein A
LQNTNPVKLGVAVCAALALALPAAAEATDAPSAGPAPQVAAASGGLSFDDPTAPTVLADGSTISAPLGELVGAVVRVHGALAGSRPGDAVHVQRLDPAAGWVDAATTTVAADGSYDASWRAERAGKTTVRAVATAAAGQAATATTAGASADGAGRAITLYRRARVTWYGPGFYGKKTACGRRMSRVLVGVASRKLPCGTMVELYNAGQTVTVPVVDRGPFRRGASYDLTAATAKALGVHATATIGAMRSTMPAAPFAAAR